MMWRATSFFEINGIAYTYIPCNALENGTKKGDEDVAVMLLELIYIMKIALRNQ